MCGITGAFDARGVSVFDANLIRRMNSTIAHRGPDDDGIFLEPGVALGHRRLSIIDLDAGIQPMSDQSGNLTIVFNGEIYNFVSLTRELQRRGYEFRTHSDTEVIIHAWSEWGTKCVDHFNGMFAFAIYDRTRRSIFLARDPLGIKPLYYFQSADGILYFASELKALVIVPGFNRRIDTSAVEDYLAFGYIPDPKTIFSNVRRLEPGQFLHQARGNASPRIETYWDIRYGISEPVSAEDAVGELLTRLSGSVESQMVADVPLGAFLSGGIDSSTVVSLMAETSETPVKTCSIGFDDPAFDESTHASAVADMYGTEHYAETVNPDLFGLLDTIAHHYDEPFADSSALPTFRVSEVARRKVKVALSGDGGDELFYGYRRHVWQRNLDRVRAVIPGFVRRPVFGLAGAIYPRAERAPGFLRGKAALQAASRTSLCGYYHGVSLVSEKLRDTLYAPGMKSSLQGYSALEVFERHGRDIDSENPFHLMQYLDMKTYLPGDILTKVDRASMAHGLEVRVPFLDKDFVSWAVNISGQAQIGSNTGKLLLKKCMRDRLPHQIADRKKMGFSVPLSKWTRGPLRAEVVNAVTESELTECGLFDPSSLTDIAEQHMNGTRDYSDTLWSLLMLQRFLGKFSPDCLA